MDRLFSFVAEWLPTIAMIYALYQLSTTLREYRQDALAAAETDQDSPNMVYLSAELIDNTVYCYDLSTNEFICQGKTYRELLDHFKARRPGCGATVAKLDRATEKFLVSNGVKTITSEG